MHGYVEINKRVGNARFKYRVVRRLRCAVTDPYLIHYSTVVGVTCPRCLRFIADDIAYMLGRIFSPINPLRLSEQSGPSVSPAFELRPREPLTWEGRDVFLGSMMFFSSAVIQGIRARLYRAFRAGNHLEFVAELESLRDVRAMNHERSVPGVGKMVETGHVWEARWSGDYEGD